MVLNVDVFGLWANLGHCGNFNYAAVVLKDLAVNGWLGAAKPKT